jgi:hypothetical protein
MPTPAQILTDHQAVAPSQAPTADHVLVQRIHSLRLAYSDDEEGVPVIQAIGLVPSGGWSGPLLVACEQSAEAKQSGLWELNLVAAKPAVGAHYIESDACSVTAIRVGHIPAWASGVRVLAAQNSASYLVIRERPLPDIAKRAQRRAVTA